MARRLHMAQKGFELELNYRWYRPIYIGLLIFTLLWDSFLIYWYSYGFTSGDEMPVIYFLFPLIHLAVGIALTYLALCLLFNSTTVSISNAHLRVRYGPIPWYRGNTIVPSKAVMQVYFEQGKEIIGGGIFYVLRAILQGNSNIELIHIYDTPISLGQIEKEVIQFLGGNDQPRIPEYKSSNHPIKKKGHVPRIISISPMLKERGLEHAQVGHRTSYDGQNFTVAHVTQYDWDNGDSDRLLQLLSVEGMEALTYVRQNKGIFHSYLESEVSTKKILQLGFDVLNAPTQLFFQSCVYELQTHRSGLAFYPNQHLGVPTDQWTYVNEVLNEHFRIVNNRGMIVAFLGRPARKHSFGRVISPD